MKITIGKKTKVNTKKILVYVKRTRRDKVK